MKTLIKLPILFFIILITSFIGCQQQHDIEKLKSQISAINDQLTKAMLSNDQEAVLKLYTDDAISLPSYEPMIKGIDALKEHSANQPPMKMKTFSLTSTDVLVSGNFVVEIGTYDLVIEMSEVPGGEWSDKGKYLTLFEIQKDGSLLIKADTWNTDTNPWMDMIDNGEGHNEGDGK